MPSHDDSDSRGGRVTGDPRMSSTVGKPTSRLHDVVKLVLFADDLGWRHALLDAEWMAWVCPHVHATAHEAESCPQKDGRVPTKVPEGLTLEEVEDFLSIPYESDMAEGEVEV